MPDLICDLTTKTFLTPAEAGELYGGSAALWRKLARQQELPSFRIGQTLIVFRRQDIEAFIESHPVVGPVEHRDGRRRGGKPGRPRKAE